MAMLTRLSLLCALGCLSLAAAAPAQAGCVQDFASAETGTTLRYASDILNDRPVSGTLRFTFGTAGNSGALASCVAVVVVALEDVSAPGLNLQAP